MRFTIEERHLTDETGRPVRTDTGVAFHVLDAENVDDLIRIYIREQPGELIGNVLKFPGFQAVATVRKPTGVYTIQVSPNSGMHLPVLK